MNAAQRENLLQKIKADLIVLMANSWNMDDIEQLQSVNLSLNKVILCGSDD